MLSKSNWHLRLYPLCVQCTHPFEVNSDPLLVYLKLKSSASITYWASESVKSFLIPCVLYLNGELLSNLSSGWVGLQSWLENYNSAFWSPTSCKITSGPPATLYCNWGLLELRCTPGASCVAIAQLITSDDSFKETELLKSVLRNCNNFRLRQEGRGKRHLSYIIIADLLIRKHSFNYSSKTWI